MAIAYGFRARLQRPGIICGGLAWLVAMAEAPPEHIVQVSSAPTIG